MTFLEQIEIMREGGNILVSALKFIKDKIKPNTSALELNEIAEKIIIESGAEPAFKNYRTSFCEEPFLYSLCVSVNEIIVHGLPLKDLIIKDGDIVSLDLGVRYKNYFTDAAITIGVGDINDENKKLILATSKALEKAIKVADAGNTFGDIGWTIERSIIDYGFKPIKDLCGHDIGEFLHGDLQVLNFGNPGEGEKIKTGMIFTIEPMASINSEKSIQCDKSQCSFKTQDNSNSSHFEATVAILENETLILTPVLDI